ncbi:MAG: hypothetical protein HFJ33_07925 [Clostridia bacterium]|nr:hypothetical protein [Clostridia bacterium]
MDFKEMKKSIIQDLENKKYVNRKISYKEFLNLYESYKNILSKQSFASILGISKSYLLEIQRDSKKRAIVLKRISASQERKFEIERELIDKGLSNSKVNYDEFTELFSKYKNEMIETKFAEILGLSRYVFQKMKSEPSKRVYILKTGEVNEELKIKIITELRNRGYSNKSITYTGFLSLYNPYRAMISENEFARVLSIDYSLFQKRTDSSKKITILRTERVDDEFKNSIIAKLNEKGYVNKKIDYAEFLELFETYKNDMTELEFSKILGITPNTYYKLKLNKSKAVILKRKEPPQEIKEKIQKDLKRAGYLDKIINYEEFLTLYENYKLYITEKEFAVILNITEGAYRSIKYSKGKTSILKEEQQLTINANEIREKILEEGYLNRLITYDEFLELYEPYKNELQEQEFASILDISLYAYKGLKRGNKAKILKYEEISEELKEEITITLIELGYLNRTIDFNEFLKLYRPYQEDITDIQFAEILGISFNGLNNLKKSYKNSAVILKIDKVSEDKIEDIRKIFIDKKYVNKRISYQEFLQLYDPYKNEMSELQFATILKISYRSLSGIKQGINKTTTILPTNEIEIDRRQEIYIYEKELLWNRNRFR